MLKTLWPHARPYSKWICLGVLCSAAEAVFELLIPLVMSDIVDIGIATGDQNFILRKGIQMVVMAMVSLCFGLGAASCSSIAGMGFGANLRTAEYDHIQDYAFSNIEKFSTASLVTRLTNDVNNLQMTLMFAMRLLVRAPVMLVAALFLSVRISYKLSNVFLVALPVLIVSVALILTKASPRFRAMQEKTDALNLVVQENLTGIRVVKSFVKEDHEREKFAGRNLDLKSNAEKAFGMVVINMPIMMLIIYGTIIAVMWFGGQMVYAGSLEAGKLITFFTYITQIMISLMMVSMIFMMMTRSIACARRIAEVLREKPAITNDGAKMDGSRTPAEVKDGSIDFDHVSFKYDPSSPEWILRDVDLHIRSGQTVGILGGTGSAKTTLVSLIPRLYEATEGTVEVGGRPVADYTMEHLRDAVSVVLQKNTLFSGTILENLRWGNPDASDEECIEACKAACADEFIDRLPDGYHTRIERGGANVSGGQKQRLCIARALLKKPKVLILDDSTSAVDTATDAKIRAAFARRIPGTTKIIIAQRISSVEGADRILVLDNGQINGLGTHEELLKTNTIYQEVYNSQTQSSGDFDKQGGEQ